jgi:hypothetical protein
MNILSLGPFCLFFELIHEMFILSKQQQYRKEKIIGLHTNVTKVRNFIKKKKIE